jgi:prepilin-type N-terminal cleavage/methylation domain-containing protein
MKRINFKKGPARNAFSIANKGGFTLIELLVVVAIIGLLAAVIMASLNNARGKGADAGIKVNLKNAIGQAEVFYLTNTVSRESYSNVCTNGTVGGAKGIGSFIQEAARQSGLSGYSTNAIGSLTTATCNDSSGAWAAEVPLRGTTGMWCVDNTGKSKFTAGSSLTTATTYVCP